jgi:hypothetical protein
MKDDEQQSLFGSGSVVDVDHAKEFETDTFTTHNCLIELPCKVGDIVYWVNNWYRTYGDYKIDAERVKEFCFDGTKIVADMDGGRVGILGKDVFTTREEAEKAIKENKQ